MFKIICVLVFVVQLATTGSTSIKKCPVNEIYMKCGPHCPQTCAYFGRDCIAPDICKPGCYCIEGYVRNSKGVCCDAKKICCPKNEIFSCGSACQNECTNLGEECKIKTLVCVENCFCIDGYARDANGKCIPEEKCPPKPCTKPNEHFERCAEIFQPSCDQLTKKECECGCKSNPKHKCSCAKPKYEAKCVCDDGYVRDQNMNCVKPAECCKRNECWKECGNPCQGTCANPNLPKVCKMPCRPGCFCEEGFLFCEKTKKCVKPSNC